MLSELASGAIIAGNLAQAKAFIHGKMQSDNYRRAMPSTGISLRAKFTCDQEFVPQCVLLSSLNQSTSMSLDIRKIYCLQLNVSDSLSLSTSSTRQGV
jgi:hypothetical protein